VFGIELQQTVSPTDELTLQFNYTYIDPKYDRWIETFTGADLSQTPFFFTPKHSGNASLNYERPLGGNLGNVHFTANAAYTDDVFINALHTSVIINQHPAEIRPLLKQESYWLFDVSAGWRDIYGTGLDVLAYVRNLTDKEYKTGGLQLYTGATGYINATYGQPRSYGMQLRYRF
jgi:iron complex outermembrane recepter protein